MNRRNILSLFTGAAASASAGIRPSDLLSAPIPGYAIENMAAESAFPGGYTPSPTELFLRSYRGSLERELDQRTAAFHEVRLPPHIASKRSWSPAFKQSEAAKEYHRLSQVRQHLWDDDWLLKVLASKGILP